MVERICESCDRKTPLYREQIYSFLDQRGLNPKIFIDADPKARLELLIRHFQLKNSIPSNKELSELDRLTINLGMLIIKPEMMRAQEKVESYISENIGVNIVTKSNFIYTPNEYWNMHGKDLANYYDRFPHGALLFLLSTVAPSKIVLFEHRSIPEYNEILKFKLSGQIQGQLDAVDDPQWIFTKFFVEDGQNSLRETICKQEVEKEGFLSMDRTTCPGMCWDFTQTFSRRTKDQNARTFNGVHSPSNRTELLSNLYVLRRVF